MSVLSAAVQFAPIILDINENLTMALRMTFEAAQKGAKIIVLPELCISGISLQNVSEASQCAQTIDGLQTQAFTQVAKKFDCTVVFGYVQYHDGLFYNSAAIVDARGIIGNVQKHNLWGPDNLWATNSRDEFPNVMVHGLRLGSLICRDAMNKYRDSSPDSGSQRFYGNNSVDVIALCTSWGSGYGYPDVAWVDLREMTSANVIVSNRVGTDRDLEFKGGSAVLSRDGNIYTNGSSFTEPAIVGGWATL
jgi:predicted amidohydrolase